MMSPDMQNMNQGPPNMGPGGAPMMPGFAPGDDAMLSGPPQGGGNFFNNFFGQQDGMEMEGVVQEGEHGFQ